MIRAVFVCALLCGLSVGASTLDALYEALDARGIPFDRSVVDEAAMSAALSTVDARAFVVSAEDGRVLATNVAVLVAEHWEQGIGYLGVPELSPGIASNLVRQVSDWERQAGLGVILDLRGTGGDSLASVDYVAGLVADAGEPIYAIQDLKTRVLERHLAFDLDTVSCRVPLVVLVDAETHDAGEVLAAVLKGQGGVMLVGAPTQGDAMVRSSVFIADGLSIVVAYGKVCLSNGDDYDGTGVQLDIPVALDAPPPEIDTSSLNGGNGRPLTEKALQDRELMKRIEKDLVLRRATDILLGLKALGAFNAAPDPVIEDVLPEDK